MTIDELEGAAKSNPPLRRVLQQIQQWMSAVEVEFGINPLATSLAGTKNANPPLTASIDVAVGNGHYVITITNPAVGTGILHEVRAATTVPVSAATDVIVLGPAADLQLDLNDPGTTRYFQLRSKFANSEYNSPIVVGPFSSGLIDSAALPASAQVQTPVSVNPLAIQTDGLPLNVQVQAQMIQVGKASVSYTPYTMSVDDQGNPLDYLLYYAYTIDPTLAGGTPWLLTLDPASLTFQDGIVTLPGPIRLLSGGGGVLFAPGQGGGVTGDSLVTMSDGTTKLASVLQKGDVLKGANGNETLVTAPVQVLNVPMFRLTTIGGKSIQISGDVTVQLGGGGVMDVFDVNPGDSLNTVDGQDQIQSKVYVGLNAGPIFRLPLSNGELAAANGIWLG